ncbi:MAG: transcription termination factor NusA [Candidatus Marinimicrobia bacterium]|nr:transcription termination factor NusA [Candidatus Neomarinimicrobiota bacterium]
MHNNQSIIEAFSVIAREKNIDRTNLGTIIEDLFMTLIEKKYGEECDNFSVIVNMEKGEIEIYQEMMIVSEVGDDVKEISLEEANQLEPSLVIGDPFIKVHQPSDFGRRLINTAKQHLSQKIKDVEKQVIFDEYESKIGEIVVGYIHQIHRDNVYVNIDKIELRIPIENQIQNDRYRRGDTVRAIVKSIDWTPRGPDIILSRSDNVFLNRLFEMEIPEIEDGIIDIKEVSRVPGDRSKVIVFSSDKRIDAVGACVGMRGSRIQAIVRELNGEKIDIINWSDQPEILISRALSPAKPIDLYIDEEKSYALAVFDDDEINRAIGKEGANIRLTKSVTEFNIDVIKKSDYLKNKAVKINDLTTLTDKHKNILIDNGLDDTKQFLDTSKEDLLKFKGLGEKTLEKINDLIIEEIS